MRHLEQNASNGTGCGQLLQLYKTLKSIKDPRILLESFYSYTFITTIIVKTNRLLGTKL